jgi:hypothetical protein
VVLKDREYRFQDMLVLDSGREDIPKVEHESLV